MTAASIWRINLARRTLTIPIPSTRNQTATGDDDDTEDYNDDDDDSYLERMSGSLHSGSGYDGGQLRGGHSGPYLGSYHRIRWQVA